MSIQPKLVAAAVFIGILGVVQDTYQTTEECQKWNDKMDRIDAVAKALIDQKNTHNCDELGKYEPGIRSPEDNLKSYRVNVKCHQVLHEMRKAQMEHSISRNEGPTFCRRVYGKHR